MLLSFQRTTDKPCKVINLGMASKRAKVLGVSFEDAQEYMVYRYLVLCTTDIYM